MKLGFNSRRRSRQPWKSQTPKSSSIDASYCSCSARFASCRLIPASEMLIRKSLRSKCTSLCERCSNKRMRCMKEWSLVTSWRKLESTLYWLTSRQNPPSRRIRVKMQMHRMFDFSLSWSQHSSCEVTQEFASNYWSWIFYPTWSYLCCKRTISHSSKPHTKPRSTK